MNVNELLNEVGKMEELQIIYHNNDSGYINVRCITSNHQKRFNVIGDLNPSSGSMRLYNEGKWISNKKLGLLKVSEIISWIKKDIEILQSKK
jgi:saccharopine dehydrogenase-like NADP-dependent oxidoreductase